MSAAAVIKKATVNAASQPTSRLRLRKAALTLVSFRYAYYLLAYML